MRVDRLDGEARSGIERSAEFARAIGSPVLTIHLFIPLDPAEFRAAGPVDRESIERFLRFYVEACTSRGIEPLIENVPPVLRMRTGGIYLSQVGGHWRDLSEWRGRIPELAFTLDTSHAALFRSFASAYPALFAVERPEELALERYVAELGAATRVAHVSNARGLLGEGLPYGSGELDLDPIVRRLGELVPYIVAEINEPDPARSVEMKKGYAAIESALAAEQTRRPHLGNRRSPPATGSTGRRFCDGGPGPTGARARRALRRAARTDHRGRRPRSAERLPRFCSASDLSASSSWTRMSIARCRPPRTRSRRPARVSHRLGDVRDGERLESTLAAERPAVLFHLAAYKHVDWAERFPAEFVDTNLRGAGTCFEPPRRARFRRWSWPRPTRPLWQAASTPAPNA